MEKDIEDAKQEEKDVPDLLEAIMRPTCLVKAESVSYTHLTLPTILLV